MFHTNSHKSALAAYVVLGALELAAFPGCGKKEDASPPAYHLPALSPGVAPKEKRRIEKYGAALEIYEYPGGVKVPVLHTAFELFPENPDNLRKILHMVPGRPGEIVRDSQNPWAQPEMQARFNCHAFALGETLGLTPRDQINGDRVRTLNMENPAAELLNSFFVRKKMFRGEAATAQAVASDRGLKDGDRIFFASGSGDHTVYAHSGRIAVRGEENWVMSKLGEDPLLLTPLETLFRVYEGEFDRVEIWVPSH